MNWIFDTSDFMPRGLCGNWTEILKYLYITSNLLIVIAYYLIPINLLILWTSKRKLHSNTFILVLFGAFIFLCGTTHLTDVIAFYYPAYRAFTLLYLITGIVSLVTAIVLPIQVKFLLTLKSPLEYIEINKKLHLANSDKEVTLSVLKSANVDLLKQIKRLENIGKSDAWVKEQESILRNLKHILKDMELKDNGN